MLTTLAAILGRLHRQQRGQVLWMAAGLIAVFGGMVALAIDLGGLMADRRDHQNAADAIALAASLELPDTDAALTAADQWAVKNDIDPANMTVTIIPQDPPAEPNPKVRVELEDEHEFTFARMIGITSATVEASAAAIKTSAAGGAGISPFSVEEEALGGVGLGDEVVLKYDANNITQGNTSPIRIDGPGSGNCETTDNYCQGLINGAENVVCADGADPTYCEGPTSVDTETGNKVSGTRTAITDRLEMTDEHCDQFTEVFEDDPTSNEEGIYRITQDCNPFLSGGYESHRVLIVPVIEELCNGSCQVTIVDFVLVFLEGFSNPTSCTGNDCEIVGRFVRVNQSVGLLAGTYDPEGYNNFVRLVE